MNKKEIELQIKKYQEEYDLLDNKLIEFQLNSEKKENQLNKQLYNIGNKLYRWRDKLLTLERKEKENKFPSKEIKAAKLLLEQYGYSIIKI